MMTYCIWLNNIVRYECTNFTEFLAALTFYSDYYESLGYTKLSWTRRR